MAFNLIQIIETQTELHRFYENFLSDYDAKPLINKWYFFSINELISHQNNFNGKFIDVAEWFDSTGLIICMAYIPKTDKFFFRIDGGIDQFSQNFNYDKYSASTYVPSEFPIYGSETYNISDPLIHKAYKLNHIQYNFETCMQIITAKLI